MTRDEYTAAVKRVDPFGARYTKRDVTGDGLPETFCNAFVEDLADELKIPLPRKLANDLVKWLESEDAHAIGWQPCFAHEAKTNAERGRFTLAGWVNEKGHGHIAAVVPGTGLDVYIAQAGNKNYACVPLAFGFGSLPVRFFTRLA